jgi:hypothetical protein
MARSVRNVLFAVAGLQLISTLERQVAIFRTVIFPGKVFGQILILD